MVGIIRSAIDLALCTAAAGALAAPCAGFDDVDSSSPFCPNVEWLRNRAITLGCAVGNYCPVSR